MSKILKTDFFRRSTLDICPDLLGKYLIRKQGNKKVGGFITEVEAYVGIQDKACHAARGKTERNKPMFEEGGIWYVYFIYGMYWMLNIVTEEKDFPAAILIRGVQTPQKYLNGPGKLTKTLQINYGFNGKLALPEQGLWFEDRGMDICRRQIKRGKRIGINHAGVWADKPWRFYYEGPL